MHNISGQVKWLLALVLSMLILAACSSAAVDEATEEEVSATVAETANDEQAGSSTAIASPTNEQAASPSPSSTTDSTEGRPTAAPTEDAAGAVEEIENNSSSEESTVEAADPGSPTSSKDGGSIMTGDDRSELLQQVTAEWNTDFDKHTVPYSEIVPVLFRDAIRSLDNPTFVSPDEASDWLTEEDPVIAIDLEGQPRAYPLRILTAHEIVNDKIGELPIVITYCPLCNSALVFNSRFEGKDLEFGTTGLLRNSDLIMYDRSSETLWQQFTGEGIVGTYAGERLEFLPSSIVSFSDFHSAFPDGKVLSIDTGFGFNYNLSSYEAYDQIGQDPYLFLDYDGKVQEKEIDRRLPAMERVVSVSLEGADIAYPVSVLSEVGAINDSLVDTDLVIIHTFGTTSAFYNPFAQRFDDVGATGVFSPLVDGEKLTFSKDGSEIVDDQTGSVWNILGHSVEGPLVGVQLEPIVHGDHFWFSWAAFKPDTLIYDG